MIKHKILELENLSSIQEFLKRERILCYRFTFTVREHKTEAGFV